MLLLLNIILLFLSKALKIKPDLPYKLKRIISMDLQKIQKRGFFLTFHILLKNIL
jgi:hypothetical protein